MQGLYFAPFAYFLSALRETLICLCVTITTDHITENDLSYKIIGVALELHRNIGPGLLESTYENALAYDLREIGLNVIQQVPMPFIYKEVRMDVGYRIDLLVENKIVIEVKSIETLATVHYSQVLTYLKLSQMKLGLLINFNCKLLKEGIHRIVNDLH